jgi:hypothetical protein
MAPTALLLARAVFAYRLIGTAADVLFSPVILFRAFARLVLVGSEL